MTATYIETPKKPTNLSEIFPLTVANNNYECFCLSPGVSKEIGNRLSWRLSQTFPNVVVIWDKDSRYFWILAKSDVTFPSHEQWRDRLSEIQEDLKEDIGDSFYTIQWIRQSEITPSIQAQLAIRILDIFCKFSSERVFSKNQVEVKREVDFWSEIVEINSEKIPAIALTLNTSLLYCQDLEHFFDNHPYRNNPEKILVGLKVREIEKNNTAKIVRLAGKIGDRRDELIDKATGSISKQKLIDAPDEQPIVSIQFSKNSKLYDYPLAALRPCVTSETANLFDVPYGELLKQTKISYSDRQKLLIDYKKEAEKTLKKYEFELKLSMNSKQYKQLFWTPETKLEDTHLLFGKGVIKRKGETLRGLFQGGVYSRHELFQDPSIKIRLAIIKPSHLKIEAFKQQLRQQLKQYGFDSILPKENQKSFSIEGLSGVNARSTIEDLVDELLEVPPDVVLVFLPESDRDADYTEEGSLYSWIYSRLLNRRVASQTIYEDTLNQTSNYRNILNQVVPGILAKLGNLPYVLAEPLDIADVILGIDISRSPKKKSSGSINACATVRFYGDRGEFIKYSLEDAVIEGEEIPPRILENFLPKSILKNKTVLIYRDGCFQGQEVEHLLARAKAINAKLILVECYKFRKSKFNSTLKRIGTSPIISRRNFSYYSNMGKYWRTASLAIKNTRKRRTNLP
jgi:Piwi domain